MGTQWAFYRHEKGDVDLNQPQERTSLTEYRAGFTSRLCIQTNQRWQQTLAVSMFISVFRGLNPTPTLFLQTFCPSLSQEDCPACSLVESMGVKGWRQLSIPEHEVCSEGTKLSQTLFLLPPSPPKPTLFLCNSATIELKHYCNRGAWYNMSGKKMLCVLPQCQNPCSVLRTVLVFISAGSRMTRGTVLAAVVRGRSLIVAFWASNFSCKSCSHTLPPGKSRADGPPIPPTCHTESKTYLLFYMCSSGPEFAELIAY